MGTGKSLKSGTGREGKGSPGSGSPGTRDPGYTRSRVFPVREVYFMFFLVQGGAKLASFSESCLCSNLFSYHGECYSPIIDPESPASHKKPAYFKKIFFDRRGGCYSRTKKDFMNSEGVKYHAMIFFFPLSNGFRFIPPLGDSRTLGQKNAFPPRKLVKKFLGNS